MGYKEYQTSHPRQVKKPKPHQYYDEPHLHCEIFKRNFEEKEVGKKYGWKQVTTKDEFGNYILDPMLRDIASS